MAETNVGCRASCLCSCRMRPPNYTVFKTIAQVKLHSKAEAEILLKSQKKTKAEVQSLARSLRNDWKVGIGTPPAGKGATAG